MYAGASRGDWARCIQVQVVGETRLGVSRGK